MDAQYRVKEIVRSRRPPKVQEIADIAEAVAVPIAQRDGNLYQKTAEDRIRKELFENGFSMSFFQESSMQKAQNRLEKTIQFAMAALKGEGVHGQKRKPVIRNHPDYENRKIKSALYIPITTDNVVDSQSDSEINIIAQEGPTDSETARRFYKRDSRVRSIALSYRSLPVCDLCGHNLSETYGEDAWKALDVHHEVPIGDRSTIQKTTHEKLKVVCCCCHAVLHRADKYIKT